MPRRPRRTKPEPLHPNIAAWLNNVWPLPLPDETGVLLFDGGFGEFERLWKRHNPNRPFIERWHWYCEREGQAKGKPSPD